MSAVIVKTDLVELLSRSGKPKSGRFNVLTTKVSTDCMIGHLNVDASRLKMGKFLAK